MCFPAKFPKFLRTPILENICKELLLKRHVYYISNQKLVFVLCKTCLKFLKEDTQPAFTCSKLTIEALEQGVKYVQS